MFGHVPKQLGSFASGRGEINTPRVRLTSVPLLSGSKLLRIGFATVAAAMLSSLAGVSYGQATVGLSLNPNPIQVTTDAVFDVDIVVDSGVRPLTAAGAFLNFDPTKLRVVDAGGAPAAQVAAG